VVPQRMSAGAKQNMKVLLVNSTLDPVAGGGTAERTYQMSRHLERIGIHCALLTLNLGLTPGRIASLRPSTVTALTCTVPRFYVFPVPEPRIRKLVLWADVVHLMGHWTMLNALVCNEARRQTKPYIVCPAGALQIYGRSRWLKATYNRIIGKRCIRKASAHVAVAPNELVQFAAYGVHLASVTLIPNGVDPDEFTSIDDAGFRQKFGLPDSPFVLFLGRLNPIKGPDLLLEAFSIIAAEHADVQLVFAGPDGGMLERLREAARLPALTKKIYFIGPIQGTDKSHAYHAACLLAIPSRHEAMSIVVIEAGICGTPVLITDQCGFDEIAAAGGGIVVPASAAGLADGLRILLKERSQLPVLGAKLRRFTQDRYLWSTIVQRYAQLFSKLLSPKANP
jgi:glycosyltransferase involved in cell wall biosynthesis